MASAFYIGRIPLTFGPESIEHGEGSLLSITGHIQENSLRKTLHYRDQLLEYARHPYDVIPVWWDDGATSLPKGWTEINGWYRISAANFNMVSYVGNGLLEYDIQLERLGGRDDVDWETVTTSSYRDTDTTSARQRMMYYPHGARYTHEAGPNTPGAQVQPTREDLNVGYPNAQWSVAPTKFITNTSSLPLLTVDGLPVVGLSMPAEYTSWSLSTGHFSVAPLQATTMGWVISHESGAVATVSSFRAVNAASTTADAAVEYVQVIHNSFSEVVLRQYLNTIDSGFIDIRVRRGDIGAQFTRNGVGTAYDQILALPGTKVVSTLGQIGTSVTVADTYSWTIWGHNTEWVFGNTASLAVGGGAPTSAVMKIVRPPPTITTWGMFFSTSGAGTPVQLRRSEIQDTYGNVIYMRDKAVRR